MTGIFIFMRNETREWRREHREDLKALEGNIKVIELKWEANMQAMDKKWLELVKLLFKKES